MERIFKRIRDSNNKHNIGWDSQNLILLTNAIASECGELCSLTTHQNNEGTNPLKLNLSQEEFKKELLFESADVIIYIAILTMNLNLNSTDLLNVINEKLDIVEKRRQLI